jgi:hypothetical protein
VYSFVTLKLFCIVLFRYIILPKQELYCEDSYTFSIRHNMDYSVTNGCVNVVLQQYHIVTVPFCAFGISSTEIYIALYNRGWDIHRASWRKIQRKQGGGSVAVML